MNAGVERQRTNGMAHLIVAFATLYAISRFIYSDKLPYFRRAMISDGSYLVTLKVYINMTILPVSQKPFYSQP